MNALLKKTCNEIAVEDYIKWAEFLLIPATVSLPRAQALLLLDEYEKQHELKNLEKRLPMVAAEVTANKSRPSSIPFFRK